MAEPHPDDAFRELVAHGHIVANPAPQPLGRGNRDRREPRTAWRVALTDGGLAKLTLGKNLGDLASRQAAFAKACPAIATEPRFHVHLAAGDALAETFFAGNPLDRADVPAAAAFAKVCDALAATEETSTEANRQAEWRAWCDGILQGGAFAPAEQQLLRDVVLPALSAILQNEPPVTRWSNGDLIAANILVGDSGARLVDTEFARRTHFFADDAVRFHVLSPVARAQPAQFSAVLPDPGPGWHLFFWLRQWTLENEFNTAAYCERVRATRLGTIRRLAEQLLGCDLSGWSVAPVPVHAVIEDARWVQTPGADVMVRGWCHVPSASTLRAVVLHGGHRCLGEVPLLSRPDVHQHFEGHPGAAVSGFQVTAPLDDANTPLLLSAATGDGTLLPFHTLNPGDLPGRGPAWGNYSAWAARHDPDPPASAPTDGPRFSILLPVFRTPPDFLRECLASVAAQHYSRWELVVVDDGSNDDALTATLQQAAARDPRIRLHPRAQNGGIARATNDALAAATGEFVVFLDHDDRLRPHALASFAEALRTDPALDALYSDEDKLSIDGRRVRPQLKPAFSPEFLLGVMYPGHALCVRTSVAGTAGGFDSAFDGIQDYEFFLRVTERTSRIGHVAKILYHWRESPGSSALAGDAKGNMDQKQAEAVRAHLRRRGDSRNVVALGHHRARLEAAATPSTQLVRCPPGTDPVAALRAAVAQSQAEILVLVDASVPADGDWLAPVAALAARVDSACVAPVLLSGEGRVLEAGWTVGPDGGQPLMRGFDPAGDGANGTLVCDREVAAVSPLCVAVRRELAAGARGEWWAFCAELRARGLYHRVCAAARVAVTASWREPVVPAPPGPPDPFYNAYFNRRRGDYSLGTPGQQDGR